MFLLHTDTHTHTHTYSVGPLWTSDRLVAETCTRQHSTSTRARYPCPLRPSTNALDRAATGIGSCVISINKLERKNLLGFVASVGNVINVTQNFSGWKWKLYKNILEMTMIFKLILKISKGTYLSWPRKGSIFELLKYHKKWVILE